MELETTLSWNRRQVPQAKRLGRAAAPTTISRPGISDGQLCTLVSLTLLSHCSRRQAPPTPVTLGAYVWVARVAPGLQSFCVGLGVHHSCARPCLCSIRQQNGGVHYTSTSCLPQVVHACAPCRAACAWRVAHEAYNRSVAMRSAMWEWYMTWLCSSCSMSSGSISSLQNKVTGRRASVAVRQWLALRHVASGL